MLQWDPAYARGVPDPGRPRDAANWTSIYSTTTGHGFKETLTVNGTGRYVRMYGTARGQRVRLLAVGVPGLRHRRQPDARHRRTGRPDLPGHPPRLRATSSTAPPAASPTPPSGRIESGTGQNNELQYYTNNNNANMDGAGELVIEARRESRRRPRSTRRTG